MADLKLLALDDEDLAVIAAHLQDAVLRVGDMAYLKADRRFAVVVNRFDWDHAVRSEGKTQRYIRRQTGVRVEHVLGAKVSGIDLTDKERVLSLLTLTFEPGEAPHGAVTLTFAGGGAVRLEVECLEAALNDLGAAWATRRKPEHAGD
ncbi:DUF2948 family protein [Hyphomicrobium sp.]|mgnify:FL=1|uniref:DUF2948 family protein n=1 Tax=Hyphomicrobium sp. TaxID=82 RepID=UPI002CBBF35F|nr:DUF2948 family protein [Hyphomicrobium sp.]HRN89950.1 DUF2948 family protein [Hyphomicrobium sp.]HRQ28308.1 DUF2948 family protein [Hyphomicrobium sp.]